MDAQFRRLELNQHPPGFSGMLDLECTGSNSQRWESNPHDPPYESGARPISCAGKFKLHFRELNLIPVQGAFAHSDVIAAIDARPLRLVLV